MSVRYSDSLRTTPPRMFLKVSVSIWIRRFLYLDDVCWVGPGVRKGSSDSRSLLPDINVVVVSGRSYSYLPPRKVLTVCRPVVT